MTASIGVYYPVAGMLDSDSEISPRSSRATIHSEFDAGKSPNYADALAAAISYVSEIESKHMVRSVICAVARSIPRYIHLMLTMLNPDFYVHWLRLSFISAMVLTSSRMIHPCLSMVTLSSSKMVFSQTGLRMRLWPTCIRTSPSAYLCIQNAM